METPSLNASQKAAADGFFDFLLSDEKAIIIDGPGGVGKTFLAGYLDKTVMVNYANICKIMGIDQKYTSLEMTALTNKAVDVLTKSLKRHAMTIYSLLGLRVMDDFETGQTRITQTRQWKIHHDTIIFIDECSMIDRTLFRFIQEATINCKIVYIGDEFQIGPVKEIRSIIYDQGYRIFRLDEPVRNAGQPALVDLCGQMRHTAMTGVFSPIKIVPGIIDWLTPDAMEQELTQAFAQQSNQRRILAYSNRRVHDYNSFVREIRNLPSEFIEGEILVSNSAVQLGNSNMLPIEEEVTINKIDPTPKLKEYDDGGNFLYRNVTIGRQLGGESLVKIPTDQEHFNTLMKFYGREKKFHNYFDMKNSYPDLRPRDASTVHKSQGSTYHTVYVDVENLGKCTQSEIAARLLNVAMSRATTRVVLYGKMPSRYGSIVV